jgi:hypothetical protein
MITLTELIEQLGKELEVDLIEALGVDSSDICIAFEDLISEKHEQLIKAFGYEDDEALDG